MSSVDPYDVEEYGRTLVNIINSGPIMLALALAQETGIVHVLCSAISPLTSTEIAQQAQLKERYVREVLGSLTSAGLVQLVSGTGVSDEQEGRFFVPEKQKEVLTSKSISALSIASAAQQYSSVKKCFPIDGPFCVRYMPEIFDILEVMGVEKKNSVIQVILKDTPGLQNRLENGIQVAEVGCGTGLLARQLITMFPRSHFTLTDIMPEPLERCKKLAQVEGLTNFTVHTLDVCNIPQDWNERFDWIFAQNVIHDLPYPQRAVQGIQRALRPGGYFSMVDIYGESYLANNVGNTEAAALYAFSALLCLPESFQKSDSEALGACWGKQRATKIVTGAGLKLLSVTKPPNLSTIAVFTCQK